MPGKTKVSSAREAKMCVSCLRTSSQSYACARCYLVTYCSQRCCEQHWSKHKDDCKFVTWHRKHVGWNFCHSCFVHACPHASSKLKRCGGCLRVSYCSRECQDNDWRYHAPICTNDKNRERPKYTTRLEDQMPLTEESSDGGELEMQLTKEKLRLELQTVRQKEEKQKRQQQLRFQSQSEREGSKEPEMWEKKFKQSKRIPSLQAKGQTPSHTIQQTHYRIRISNTPPVLHEGFRRNADNTASYEEEIEEKQPDGTITIKKTYITNGVIENDAQFNEITRQFDLKQYFPGGSEHTTAEAITAC